MHLPLRAITVFHTAARAGSVSRAAQELGVTPSAVSQQIASLEVHLGTSLMVKSGRHVVLTEAGERHRKRSGVLVLEVPERARHPEPVDEVAFAAPQPISLCEPGA